MSEPGPPPAPAGAWATLRDPGFLIDVGPVVALSLVSVAFGDFSRSGDLPTTVLAVALPLAVRRSWPLVVLLFVAAGVVMTDGRGGWVDVAAVALASYTMGDLAEDRWRSALGVFAVAGGMAIGFVLREAEPVIALTLPFVILVPSWVIGDVVHGRRQESVDRRADAARSERERVDRLRASIAEERRHVAREMHDVVAHAVSVMLIQAGAARHVLRASPDEAEGALLAVEATGREAMDELRRLLGVLSDEGEATGLAPQPGIDQLAALVQRVRDAGLPTELEIDGARRPLPSSIDVTVYRIIQEALTNALRYAQRARTLVHVSYEGSELRVEVLDDGPATDQDAGESSGRGLVGMRERASLVGGRLEAGPRIGGGYAVRAWLPLEPRP